MFVFSSTLGNAVEYVAQAASHEAGHAFGLEHQILRDANGFVVREYNPGANGIDSASASARYPAALPVRGHFARLSTSTTLTPVSTAYVDVQALT